MLLFVSFEVTIVADSVFFSWDLDPRASCDSFFGCCNCVCKTILLCQRKLKSSVIIFLLMMIKT